MATVTQIGTKSNTNTGTLVITLTVGAAASSTSTGNSIYESYEFFSGDNW